MPGTKSRRYGAEKRIAAFLWFNKEIGDTFTMKEIRAELGEGAPEDQEQLDRRLRAIRPDGWYIPGNKDDRSLPLGTYRLVTRGTRVWLGERVKRDTVSAKTRRVVLERDGRRCQICGVGSNEEYPGEPGSKAVMTVGHMVPGQRLGSARPDSLRTECARCNEPMRDQAPDPETYDEVLPEVRSLRKDELRALLEWLLAGRRLRSRLDHAYDRIRQLTPSDRDKMQESVTGMIG